MRLKERLAEKVRNLVEEDLPRLSNQEVSRVLEPTGYYLGIPPELIAPPAAAVAAAVLKRSIKVVRQAHEGVRVTLGKVDETSLEPGPYLVFPIRRVQRIVEASTQPAPARFKGVGRGLLGGPPELGGGTQVSGDVTPTLQILSAPDAVKRIDAQSQRIDLRPNPRTGEYSPAVREFLTGIVGPQADYAMTEEVPRLQGYPDLMNPDKVVELRERVKERMQQRLDHILLEGEPGVLAEIESARVMRAPRSRIRRGVLVSDVAIENFAPSDELVEALQEQAGAVPRANAEMIMQEALGPNYPVYSDRRTGIEAAEQGATTVVVGSGAGREPMAAATLGRVNKMDQGKRGQPKGGAAGRLARGQERLERGQRRLS